MRILQRVLIAGLFVSAALIFLIRYPTSVSAQQEAAKAEYVGAEQNCRMCHSDMYNGWAKTPHANAFKLLENVGKATDPACLPCHTTGYGEGGYKDEATTPNLKGVQCEMCHGPGSEHNGDKTKIIASPPAKRCAKCHMNLGIHGMG